MRLKRPANFRLTPEAIALLAALAKRRGISRAAVLELLIRKEAKAEKILVSEGIDSWQTSRQIPTGQATTN